MAQRGFESEAIARQRAAEDMPNKHVVIIQSQGQFYVETGDGSTFIRSWEREVYSGLGKNAAKKARVTA